jgi:hypothetical protein
MRMKAPARTAKSRQPSSRKNYQQLSAALPSSHLCKAKDRSAIPIANLVIPITGGTLTTMSENVPFIWRVNYRNEAASPETVLEIAHEKAANICRKTSSWQAAGGGHDNSQLMV